jgi:glucose/arabinose dehydrogenase
MRRASSTRQSPRRLLARLLAALAVAAALGGAVATASPAAPEVQQLDTLQLPPGFHINIFAEGLGYVRLMTFSPQGDLVASSSSRELAGAQCSGGTCVPNDGRVFVLPDRDRDGVADRTVVFAEPLDRPQGLAYRDGVLYVGAYSQVVRLPDRDGDLRADDVEVVVPNLPTGPSHWSRNIAFGPDGKLYVHAGSSCNVCEEADERRAAITQYNADGTGERVFARGLRNAVGITFHPTTGELWATNNNRDLLDDNFPPEFVSIVRDGDHFGWPFCHVGVPDPDFGYLGDCSRTRAPTVFLPPHSAPLGLAFYTGQQFPAEYRGDLFVALHGSWNRSVPQGYKVVRIPMAGGVPGPVEDFISGWLPAQPDCNNLPADAERDAVVCRGNAWGRPVGLAVGPDGAMYLSDDRAGLIYRITYAP